ncbi:MAG TPA: hypothetical protein PKJ56_12700, partial [Promineifilum sp.]|nr:hypothetical protein [Promineifilum sp.]
STGRILTRQENGGRFQPLSPAPTFPGTLRFTAIQMQESLPPESGELDLTPFENQAVLIEGHDGGGWIYSARITDHASPIVTLLAKQLFARNF